MTTVKDFWAVWCGPCKMMHPIVEELEKELVGRVNFEKINVDEMGDLAARQGVVSIPTYIIEKDGKEVDRLIGARPKDSFKRWIESYI